MCHLVEKVWPGCTCRINLCWAHSVSIGHYRRRRRKRMLFLWIELGQLDPIRDVSASNVTDFLLGSLRQNWHLLQIIKGGLWYRERGFISFCHIQEKWLTEFEKSLQPAFSIAWLDFRLSTGGSQGVWVRWKASQAGCPAARWIQEFKMEDFHLKPLAHISEQQTGSPVRITLGNENSPSKGRCLPPFFLGNGVGVEQGWVLWY